MKDAIEELRQFPPHPVNDGGEAVEARLEYARQASPIGSLPPPASMRQAATTALKQALGQHANLFLDKVGERMAFERTGVRLYELLMAKFDAKGGFDGGPTRDDLQRIHNDEFSHFQALKDLVEQIGGDPTVVTPAANVAAVASMGIEKVLSDPRTNLPQCLDAILIAELADNDCWTALMGLSQAAGASQLGESFQSALANEREHLEMVRSWLRAYQQGGVSARSREP
jgi:rubrerythrin